MTSVTASTRQHPAWGNLVLCALLACLVVGLGVLHAGEGEWHDPGAVRWGCALFVLLLWSGLLGAVVRQRRRTATPLDDASDSDALLVAFASQTGTAVQLAIQTTASLQQAGLKARVIKLGECDAAQLAQAGRVLFVVSTTGEGDAPDSAARFVTQCMREPASLATLQYGLLALGDRDYHDFCAFARQLEHWLQRSGATPLFDTVQVDNGDAAALRHWQHHLALLSGAAEWTDWETPAYQRWQLVERRLLNPGSVGGPCFHLALRPLDGAITWQAGDLVEIGPRHAADDVARWLRHASIDGEVAVSHGGRTLSLSEWLTSSHLPAFDEVLDKTPDAIVAQLSPLPHREYSIASLPADGSLHLLVRRMFREDGSVGLGSGWLTQHAAVGEEIALRVRSNPGFHAPTDGRPLILIGNGTGLAGLRALLKERAARGHTRNWLLFGERQQAHDFHHAADILAWQRAGQLARVDLAWSRDASPAYVQDRLREAADELRRWIAQDAAIYVCGSLAGMAPGVDAVLRQALGDATVEQLREQGRYRRDVY